MYFSEFEHCKDCLDDTLLTNEIELNQKDKNDLHLSLEIQYLRETFPVDSNKLNKLQEDAEPLQLLSKNNACNVVKNQEFLQKSKNTLKSRNFKNQLSKLNKKCNYLDKKKKFSQLLLFNKIQRDLKHQKGSTINHEISLLPSSSPELEENYYQSQKQERNIQIEEEKDINLFEDSTLQFYQINQLETESNLNNNSNFEMDQAQNTLPVDELNPSSSPQKASEFLSDSSQFSTPLSSNKIQQCRYIIDGENILSSDQLSELHLECNNMPILILDLDNTLVHSTIGDSSWVEQSDDSVIKVEMDKQAKLLVKLRPFLREFFQLAFKQFQVVMFTLGSISYAKNAHQIFKESFPEIFSSNDFLRIIAQPVKNQRLLDMRNIVSIASSAEKEGMETCLEDTELLILKQLLQVSMKDISKYFPFKEFQHRLLILDDNQSVYDNQWIQNVIFTKPYKYWIDNTSQTIRSSDSFLFFAGSLLGYLCDIFKSENPLPSQYKNQQQKIMNKMNLSQIYNDYKKSMLSQETLYLCPLNPNGLSLKEIAKELGAKIVPEKEPNCKIVVQNTFINMSNTEELQYIPSFQNYGNDVISEDWIKFCYILNCRVPYEFFLIDKKIKYEPLTLELELAKKFASSTVATPPSTQLTLFQQNKGNQKYEIA